MFIAGLVVIKILVKPHKNRMRMKARIFYIRIYIYIHNFSLVCPYIGIRVCFIDLRGYLIRLASRGRVQVTRFFTSQDERILFIPLVRRGCNMDACYMLFSLSILRLAEL